VNLLDKRLAIVTGKGGVGRSTISAALALILAGRGKRVLVCEVNARERVAPLFGAKPSGHQATEVRPGIFTVNVTPPEAMREYGVMVLHSRTLYRVVFENRLVASFLRAIPSLAELVMLGKILHEVRVEEAPGKPRWDAVIVDAPATGHAVQLLRVPQALLEAVPPGPLRRDAGWMDELLRDPTRTGIAIVAVPEEMPVSEAIDLDGQLRALRLPLTDLLLNAMPERRFNPDEGGILARRRADSAPVGPAAAIAHLQALRAAEAGRYGQRLREAISLPAVEIPFLAAERWDQRAVGQVAAALER
jgi:anion-transporting  ArsA/GET3 family ATPase